MNIRSALVPLAVAAPLASPLARQTITARPTLIPPRRRTEPQGQAQRLLRAQSQTLRMPHRLGPHRLCVS